MIANSKKKKAVKAKNSMGKAGICGSGRIAKRTRKGDIRNEFDNERWRKLKR